MTQLPGFDPFELLGVDASADAATIDRAYKARIRYVHPDIAGVAGLNETKRLNIARDWLLDAELRAQLPPPVRRWGRRAGRESPPPPPPSTPPPPASPPPPSPPPPWSWERAERARPAWEYEPLRDEPLAFDYGPAGARLSAFFEAMRALSSDERARVTYSLGDEPPFFFDEFKDVVGETLWNRSLALVDAVAKVWAERLDEARPLLFPRGRVFGNGAVVANAYAQWILLGDVIRQRTRDADTIEALASRSTLPWESSVGHARYGPAQAEVTALLDEARVLPLTAAERLARSWDGHMGGYLYGRPGEDWFPGTLARDGARVVSARLAAVDASRIEPPEGLPYPRHNAFRCGLRLTAHVLALGDAAPADRDLLRPWRDALDTSPSFMDRARWGMPLG
jgi:hypothetical protein